MIFATELSKSSVIFQNSVFGSTQFPVCPINRLRCLARKNTGMVKKYERHRTATKNVSNNNTLSIANETPKLHENSTAAACHSCRRVRNVTVPGPRYRVTVPGPESQSQVRCRKGSPPAVQLLFDCCRRHASGYRTVNTGTPCPWLPIGNRAGTPWLLSIKHSNTAEKQRCNTQNKQKTSLERCGRYFRTPRPVIGHHLNAVVSDWPSL